MDDTEAGAASRSLVFGLAAVILLVGGCMGWMAGAGRRARTGSGIIVRQFAPGGQARRFLAYAHALGADQFSFEADGAAAAPGAANSLDRKARDFRERWPAFEADFERLASGAAEVRFTGAPPYERYYCRIEFKDGRVVAMRRRLLD